MTIIRTSKNHRRESKDTIIRENNKSTPSNRRGSRTSYQKFREQVLVRDHYQCTVCGWYQPKGLRVHHLYSWKENKSRRMDPEYAVTLCAACHDSNIKGSFHYEYGTVDNTLTEFSEYYYKQTGLIFERSELVVN